MNPLAQILINDQKVETHFPWGSLKEKKVSALAIMHQQESGLNLCSIREYRLEEGEELTISYDEEYTVIIIPLVNDMQLELRRFEKLISVAGVGIFDVNQADIMKITTHSGQAGGLYFQLFLFKGVNKYESKLDLAKLPIGEMFPMNKLLPIQHSQLWPLKLYFGTFQSKYEDILLKIKARDKIFAYCLEGCFEVEKRLLFQGDGLLIQHLKELEVECLSEEGLIILVVL